MRARPLVLLQAVAAAALLAHVAHTAAGLGGPAPDALFDRWLYHGLMLGAAAGCLARGVLVREDRAAWLLLGLGAASWSAGDLYFSLALADDPEPPFPSASDALFLAFYPLCCWALALLVRRHVREFHLSLWVDGVTGALAVAAVCTALLYDAVSVSVAGEPLVIAAALAYPAGDVLLLAFVVALFALTGWRPGLTVALLGGALALGAIGDAAVLIRSAQGTYAEGTVLDSLWPASLLLLALAAARPSRFNEARLSPLLVLAMPFVFGLTAVGLLVLGQVEPLNPLTLALACATVFALLVRMAVTLRENLEMVASSRGEALTDALTGLGNRRKLVAALETDIPAATADAPLVLLLFDLDGFKRYNDGFGHLAGDALLARLGAKLAAAVRAHGDAYRLGGDEFCAVVRLPEAELEPVLAAAAAALSDRGEGFEVRPSYGAVVIPHEAATPSDALQLADRRMYARKGTRPVPERLEMRDVLVRALEARGAGVQDAARRRAEIAVAVGRRLGMEGEELDELARAAELHDLGKVALPDAILDKPEKLDDEEWAFVRRHPLLAERILSGSPAMRPVARLVRSAAERFDGLGYPDGLAGEMIPLGARVIAVCRAYDAMLGSRPYRSALDAGSAADELRRAAGTQFDPRVVQAFLAELEHRADGAETPVTTDGHMDVVREVAGQLRDVMSQGGTRP
jgi:two-component system, cell cycle response regulator